MVQQIFVERILLLGILQFQPYNSFYSFQEKIFSKREANKRMENAYMTNTLHPLNYSYIIF